MITRILRQLYGLYALTVLGVAIFVVFFPLIIVAPTLPLRRGIGRVGMRVVFALMGVPFRVRGLEHLPAGPCIVVSNHASYLDGLVLTAALPGRFSFVVKDGAARAPYIGLALKRMGVIFVSRTDPRSSSLQTRTLIRRVQDGESLAIFPEGTFRQGPGLLRFHDGGFLMATRANVPVVPLVIRGTRTLLGDRQWLPRHARVEVEAMPARMPPGADRSSVHALRDAARRDILARCGEPDAMTAHG